MTEENSLTINGRTMMKYILCGMLIGGGGILPGVSGGVLCVLFGIYRPMMALFANPFSTLKRHYRMFIPVVIGGAFGFVLFAKILSTVFERYELYATWVFVGLIAGEIPSMFKDAKKQGRKKRDILALIIAFAVLFTITYVAKKNSGAAPIAANTTGFLFCGVLWGLSIVVPGMSSSSILMSLGLYMPLTVGVAALDFAVIIPWGIGLAVTILLCAKGVNLLFEKHYSIASHCIVGIVAASTVIIIPTVYGSVKDVILSAVFCVVGFIGAYLMNRFDLKGSN